MERTTHRQFRVWMEWFRQEWNRPSRSDWYLMRIAQRVLQAVARSNRANTITLEDQKIEWVDKRQVAGGMTVEQATAIAKAKWLGPLRALRRRAQQNRKVK